MGWPRCSSLSNTLEGRYDLTQQPLQELYPGLTLQAAIALTGITPERRHALATAVHTVTIQEDVQGHAQYPLVRLIE